MIYSDKSAFNIILQSESNGVNVNLKINAVFNFLNVFYFCSVHYHKTLSINFISDAAISAKNLINY